MQKTVLASLQRMRSTQWVGSETNLRPSLEFQFRDPKELPGKPVAYSDGLLLMDYGLLWSVVAYHFRLLGFPGSGIDAWPSFKPGCDCQKSLALVG